MKLYLLMSDSKTLMDKKINEIIKKSPNVISYSYKDSTITDILEEASYVSFFEEEKFLIVKNTDFFSKGKLSEKDTEKLLQYFENPYPHTTLIFTTYEDIDKRKSITKKIEEIGDITVIKAPKNYDLFLAIKKQMSIYKVDDHVIRYMIEACLGSYDFLQNEIDKLSLKFKAGDTISLNEIKKIIVPNVNDNVFKFVDAVISKDAYQIFHLLEDFLTIKTDVLQLMNLLVREYRFIYYYKILERKCFSSIDIAKELKVQDWQLDKIRKEASKYHEDDIKDYLIVLSKLDVNIKSGKYEKNTAFQSFLVNLLEY